MARAFSKLAFTANVKAVQSQMGSRHAFRQTEEGPLEEAQLGFPEIAFIQERDSFYQATVGENGWPYVQHRGGPAGFLRVLDARTLAYADFTGNRQYISVGNLLGDNRVALILMDYVNQRRLKIWGCVRVISEEAEPALMARLVSPGQRTPVERGIVISVQAFDWNCPKYITPRFTLAQAASLLQAEGKADVRKTDSAPPSAALGAGPLALTVTGVQQLTPRIRAYELRRGDWSALPEWDAGAHLVVPVQLGDGSMATRQYSLATPPARRDMYRIAVLRETEGRGASAAIHRTWQLGTRINIAAPSNQFPLHQDPRPAILIAGGIGITPMLAMAEALKQRGAQFQLHYSGRSAGEMAFRDRLIERFPEQLHLYFTRAEVPSRPDIPRLMQTAPPDAVFYVCGPRRLIDAVRQTAHQLGIPEERVQVESFE